MVRIPAPPEGCLDGALHRFPVRVYFEDTDANGIVYHPNFLRWFERARSDLLRLLGIDVRAALEDGTGNFVIAEVSVRYLKPAKLGDAVMIESSATDVRAASWKMHQKAIRDGELLAEAFPRIGFVSPDGRPRRQPGPFLDALRSLIEPGCPV